MKKINITLGGRSYPIVIAAGLLNDPISFLPLKSKDKVMLVTNETVAPLYLDKVSYALKKAGVKADTIILPDGEKHKNLVTLNKIFTALLQKSYHRNTTLIALGGGVIGDLTGFAAASYQRGICFIQIPTTLLSQVDSSIGGKTAVNHSLGKNMIGAFHQPTSVIIDLDCLKTLPMREFISGLAEVVKYGISVDKEFFFWLEENVDSLLSLDIETIKHCVYHCCELKAKIISKDECENDLRLLLNFGHTYGHAIETGVGYGKWLHGEAVSVGVVMAIRTSERLGQFSSKETQRVTTLLKRIGLPIDLPKEISKHKYLCHIMRDKKMLSSDFRLILPISIGESKVFDKISKDIVLDVFDDCQKP